MIVKAFIIIALLFIIGSLGSGLFFLVNDKGQSDRVVKALTWRIGLSIGLFLLLILCYLLGWITPNAG